MDETIAGELERVGRVHELLRMLRVAEREEPSPQRTLEVRRP